MKIISFSFNIEQLAGHGSVAFVLMSNFHSTELSSLFFRCQKCVTPRGENIVAAPLLADSLFQFRNVTSSYLTKSTRRRLGRMNEISCPCVVTEGLGCGLIVRASLSKYDP